MGNKIIEVNDKHKRIDQNYFSNYGGDDYGINYINYTFHPMNILTQLTNKNIFFDTLLDAGCASGELVSDFRKYGIKAYGIENNKEILKKSVCPQYCTYGDLLDLSFIKDNTFDVIYCNAMMYLLPTQCLDVLKEFNRICTKAVFLCNPFLGETDKTSDHYRTFLATPKWWAKQFEEADFTKVTKNIYLKN